MQLIVSDSISASMDESWSASPADPTDPLVLRLPPPLPGPSARFVTWQVQLGLLSSNPDSWLSQWTEYHQTYAALLCANLTELDATLNRQIHVDVSRLSRYSHIFGTETPAHFARMERILCLFARFSAPTGYRQAFHELLFPLYFVAVTGDLELDVSEAIAFFMFHSVLNGSVIGDFFLSQTEQSAITEISDGAQKIVRICDPALHRQLVAEDLNPLLFAFPWLSVLFCQLYPLEAILKIWDFLLGDLQKMPGTLECLVAAHLMTLRQKMMGKSFCQVMAQFSGLMLDSEVKALNLCKRIQQAVRMANP
jgi:hypothetical protein